MKQLILTVSCVVIAGYVLIISCKKEQVMNHAPIARAGADITITLDHCSYKNGVVTLDGSNSSDPDNNITIYSWAKISGPGNVYIRNMADKKTEIANISAGIYHFELLVHDAFGFSSRDTVKLIAESTTTGPEYDFEISTKAKYIFTDNLEECYYGCAYSDFTTVNGVGSFLPLGDFFVYIQEYADTATSSNVHETNIYVGAVSGNGEFISGDSPVNFKKLIQNGGGAFSATFTATNGSAVNCGDAFKNLRPLLISGSLDTATHAATITIKGRVLF